MKKNNFFGLLAMIMGFGFLAVLSCSKDDGCETKTYYLDKDKDGYGAGAPTTACKPPTATVGQYVTKNGDTDDTNVDIFPGCTATNYYVDNDGDGYGTGNAIASCVELVGKYATQNGDLDDNDANVNPGCTLVFYLDADGDGFGVGDPILFCANPDGDKYTDNDTAFDCDDTDPNINPDASITYYPDNDGDGYGDPLSSETVSQPACDPAPEGFVTNNEDCDDQNENANPGIGQITYYPDLDHDGYGDGSNPIVQDSCDEKPEINTVLQGDDCDDSDPDIHPGAPEMPNDGIDSDCGGEEEAIIWDGPSLQFSKAANDVNWADSEGTQDQITKKIALTRSNNGFITNITWWFEETGQSPTEDEDLPWEYFGRKAQDPPMANVGGAIPNGGPQGVRWAILEQGENNQAWSNFGQLGTLGDPTHFYSLNNIVTICASLDANLDITDILDDFGIDASSFEDSSEDASSTSFPSLEGKKLGVWLVEDDIYFTLTFDKLSYLNQGGEMTYTRSTPNN
ncbi:MAG: MopE-related protein [Allomuricauda sp.]